MVLQLVNATIIRETKAAVYIEVCTRQVLKTERTVREKKEAIWLPKSVLRIEQGRVNILISFINFVEIKEKEIAAQRNVRLVEILVKKIGE